MTFNARKNQENYSFFFKFLKIKVILILGLRCHNRKKIFDVEGSVINFEKEGKIFISLL